MKSFCCLLSLALLLTYNSYSQFTFSVSPGLGFSGAAFGYSFGNIVPYIGIQYLGVSASYEDVYYRYDGSVRSKYTDNGNVSINLFIPQIGCKIFVINENDLHGYANANLNYAIITGDISPAEEDFQKVIDNSSIFGIEAGFGVEYNLSKSFSIGGEFGLRLYYISTSEEGIEEIYNPNNGNYESAPFSYDFSVKLRATYGKIALNYYFGR